MHAVRNRDLSVDIVKALGIIFMVGGHCGLPITHFVYLFHMAIFFIAAGYCYKPSNSMDYPSVLCFIKRKIITLWFPYVLWTAIYSILHNFFIRINVYTDNPLLLKYVSGEYIGTTEYWTFVDVFRNIIEAMLLHGKTQMGGALWFLATLMEISVGYCIIDFILNSISKKNDLRVFVFQSLISILFLCMGFACYKTEHSLWRMNKVLSFYILFHGGYTMKKYGWSIKDRKKTHNAAIFILCFVVLLISNMAGSIALDRNSYVDPIFLLIVSFAGWQFLYEIAVFLQKSQFSKKIFVCIGQNTLAVLVLHFLCFKIVSFIGVLVNQQPLFLVAAFPVLYLGGIWWIAYMSVGLAIPIALSILWKKVRGMYNILCIKLHHTSKLSENDTAYSDFSANK